MCDVCMGVRVFDSVVPQLQLPEQTEKTHWLTFSLVEKYFYRKQREMCQTEASKVCMYIHAPHEGVFQLNTTDT